LGPEDLKNDVVSSLDDRQGDAETNADFAIGSGMRIAKNMLGIPMTSTSVCTLRNMLDLLGLDAATRGFGKSLA